MANFKKCFSKEYLTAADILEPIDVVIKHVTIEEMPTDGGMRPVLYFKGLEQGLVCNHTNADTLAELAGSDMTEDLIGQHITLYTETTRYAGKSCLGIRLRGTRPSAVKAAKKNVEELADDKSNSEGFEKYEEFDESRYEKVY